MHVHDIEDLEPVDFNVLLKREELLHVIQKLDMEEERGDFSEEKRLARTKAKKDFKKLLSGKKSIGIKIKNELVIAIRLKTTSPFCLSME